MINSIMMIMIAMIQIIDPKSNELGFGIPDVGLHLSGHMPRPPRYPYAHLHLKCDSLGIHEDILDFNPKDLADYYQDFAEQFIDNLEFEKANGTVLEISNLYPISELKDYQEEVSDSRLDTILARARARYLESKNG